LKLIHCTLLPVRYSDTIYDLIKDGVVARGALLYLYDDTAVGEICWCIDDVDVSKSCIS
jgi:hypothetical protein